MSARLPSSSRRRCAVASVLLLLGLGTPAAALTPLADFSTNRYPGRWYEIAAIPGYFRNQCERDVQVEYTLEEGGAFAMVNRCKRPDGEWLVAEARGRALDPDVPSVLKVTSVHALGIWWYPFGRNQIVIAAGPGYRWLAIGDPTLRYGRVLSRGPSLDAESLRAIDAALAAEGYDRCQFVLKPQSGGRQQPGRLCDEVPRPLATRGVP